jgi:hypothetical protein
VFSELIKTCQHRLGCSSSLTTSNRASGCGHSATPNDRKEQPLTCTNAAEPTFWSFGGVCCWYQRVHQRCQSTDAGRARGSRPSSHRRAPRSRPVNAGSSATYQDRDGPVAGVLLTSSADDSWQCDPVSVLGVSGCEPDVLWGRALEHAAELALAGFDVRVIDGDGHRVTGPEGTWTSDRLGQAKEVSEQLGWLLRFARRQLKMGLPHHSGDTTT